MIQIIPLYCCLVSARRRRGSEGTPLLGITTNRSIYLRHEERR